MLITDLTIYNLLIKIIANFIQSKKLKEGILLSFSSMLKVRMVNMKLHASVKLVLPVQRLTGLLLDWLQLNLKRALLSRRLPF